MKVKRDNGRAAAGPVATPSPGKSRITIRIDQDVLSWFRDQVNLAGSGNYQTLMNQALRRVIETKEETLENTLRRIIREELGTGQGLAPPAEKPQKGTAEDLDFPDQLGDTILSKIADLCRRWHISRLALFGSAVRVDFNSESDIDILVEFEPGHVPGFDFITIQDELTEVFGIRVDLHTPATLSRYFRDDVLDRARTIYDAA